MSLESRRKDIIIVYGLGGSGTSCLKFLLSRFDNSKIYATDDNQKAIENAKNNLINEGKFDKFSLDSLFIDPNDIKSGKFNKAKIVLAPGISLYYPDRKFILDYVDESQIICDIELFNDIFLGNRPSESQGFINIGVTGTNGKSTICSFIDYILTEIGVKSSLVGNIGVPIFDIANDLLSKKDLNEATNKLIVTEISSFQLDLVRSSSFDVCAISNISQDHMDRYDSFDSYIESKFKIFHNSAADDYVILNNDDEALQNLANRSPEYSDKFNIVSTSTDVAIDNGVALVKNKLFINIFNLSLEYDLDNLSLRGRHNHENYVVAVACILCALHKAQILNKEIVDNIVKSSLNYSGLRHRMQPLGVKNNINFVNDSKATNPDSVVCSLDSHNDIFWILGGKYKGGDLDQLSKYMHKIKKAYLIGTSVDEIEKFLKKNDVKYEICFNLDIAFNNSVVDAKNYNKNCSIILSPACASFDQWRSFEERGDYFCKLFNEI